MSIKVSNENNILTLYLIGDIDHHSAKEMREVADRNIDIYNPKILVIDFKEVPFMDTSGIGLVMGRYKLMKSINGKIKLVNLNSYIKRIINLSGLNKIVEIV